MSDVLQIAEEQGYEHAKALLTIGQSWRDVVDDAVHARDLNYLAPKWPAYMEANAWRDLAKTRCTAPQNCARMAGIVRCIREQFERPL